ncbi:hypothetical protein SRB5_12560 [Streptomyces sp. RB5]|uniref:SHOCT domain-containing protein n=1 Tax=Streptomyces smaragdinus TaxID=2585196 RepID=A0A7K0CDJ0_9ACTN|nr:SHOCT domain-containing protein [Streptomyces smaragdinus]MQY11142.1 hypothetical protein [Streptomyces smaragdinus]
MTDDYSMLDLFLTMLWFFLWIMWLFLLFRVVMDIFRDHDLSGWGKAGWLIFCILLPYLGVLVYVIARGRGMGQRDIKQAKDNDAAFRAYVRDAAGTGSASHAEQLAKLADLRDRGAITEAEFQQAKVKILT